MSLDELVIHSPESPGKKGRAFRALKVSAIMADALLPFQVGDKHDRPVYACFAGSEAEMRPFAANLLCGRPAVPLGNQNRPYRRNRGAESGYEFMRSAGYKTFFQRHEEGTILTVYLPELVALDPGMVDPKGVKFLVIPGAGYLEAEAKKLPTKMAEDCVSYARALPAVVKANEPERDWRGHVYSHWVEPLPRERLTELVPLSYLFALYLGNRTRAPIPPSGLFYIQLLLACLDRKLAAFSGDGDRETFGQNKVYKFLEEGAEEGKLGDSIAFMADHEEVEVILAAECATYFSRVEE